MSVFLHVYVLAFMIVISWVSLFFPWPTLCVNCVMESCVFGLRGLISDFCDKDAEFGFRKVKPLGLLALL